LRNAIVNSIRQGIRQSIRGSGEPVPTFGLPLKDSLDTNIASTRAPATFTRDSAGEQIDEQGKSNQVLSNESRHDGARRVENLITASEDMTNGAYVVSGGITVDSATQITNDGTANQDIGEDVTITDDGSGAGGRTFVFSCKVTLVSGTVSSNGAIEIRMGGSAITSASTSIGDALSSTAQRFYVSASTDAAGTVVKPFFRIDDAVTLKLEEWQLEEVTGQLNQNPGEYVSTGVGTGILGPDTKTDVTGWSVMDATHTPSSPNVIAIDNSSGGPDFSGESGVQIKGQTYEVSYTVSDYVGGSVSLSWGTGNAGVLRSANGTYVETNVITGNDLVYLRSENGADCTVTINHIKLVHHGSNASNVKYFPYHNGNTKAIRKFLDPPQLLADDFRIDADIRFDGYSNGVTDTVIGHFGNTARRGWVLSMRGTGTILFSSSPDGTSGNQVTFESSAHGLTDVTRHTISAVYDHSAGAMSFYVDGTLLSTDSGGALTDIYYEATDPLEIGAIFGGTADDTPGQVFSAQVRQSTDATATPIIDFNAEDHSSGSTLTSSTTGEVWTLNADAFIDNEETGVVTEAQGPAINSSTSQRMMLDGG
jgi:hypothetical protein